MGVSIDLVIKLYLIEPERNWNVSDLQLIIHMPIKLTSTLEGDLIVKITKVRFQ